MSLGGDRIVEHRRVQRAPPPPLTAPPPRPSTLMLLYAQPVMRIAALKTTTIILTPQELRISLGAEPIPVPQPFAGCLDSACTTGLTSALPATARPVVGCSRAPNPDKHVEAQYVMKRLRRFAVNLLGARNSDLQNLVAEVPLPSSAIDRAVSNS